MGLDHWLLLDRYKWPNNRALRFDWAEILDRKDADTLKACAALLHKDCLAPGEGNSLLETLDENAHKHAFGVSEDLKYALQRSFDLQPAPQNPGPLLVPGRQGTFAGFETQLPLRHVVEPPRLHDRLGQLRISRLREHFPRVEQVEAVAAARRFMHWELCFADVLIRRGGFDLILGNPPWLKVGWNESGVLGEYNPVFARRRRPPVSGSATARLG